MAAAAMIPYFDYRIEHNRLREEIEEAVRRVFDSGRLILGPEVESFEYESAAAAGVSAAVGVASGTDALILALRALDLGPGDEVVTVANAGAPTVAAIRSAGATPVFVDVLPDTLLLDPGLVEQALTERTRCILPVHLYGQSTDMEPILEIARARGLRVVEDCAQAQGALYGERPVGSLGDVGCLSFYPTKILGAYGDGGMCLTDDGAVGRRLRSLRMYGFRDGPHSREEGMNSRLDEIQAAILRVKLREIDHAIRERNEIARIYREGLLDAPPSLLGSTAGGTHVHHLFVVRSPERDRLIRVLEKEAIGFGIHYPEPVHRMEAYRFLGYREGDLPVTERACREVLSLPIYPGMDPGDAGRVVDVLRSAW